MYIKHNNLNYCISEMSTLLPHTRQILVDDESTHVKIFDTHVGTQNQA